MRKNIELNDFWGLLGIGFDYAQIKAKIEKAYETQGTELSQGLVINGYKSNVEVLVNGDVYVIPMEDL